MPEKMKEKSSLIPLFRAQFIQLNPVQKQGQSPCIQLHLRLPIILPKRPTETPPFESFTHQPIPTTIPIQNLEPIVIAVRKQEQRTAAWILFEHIASQGFEPIVGLAHIARLNRNENPHRHRQVQHRPNSRQNRTKSPNSACSNQTSVPAGKRTQLRILSGEYSGKRTSTKPFPVDAESCRDLFSQIRKV
jgi:hypothetical protein